MKQVKSLTKLYTTEEVADALRLPVEQVRIYMRAGELKHYRFGHKTIRFTQNQYEDFLKKVLV